MSAIAENSPDAIFAKDVQGPYLLANLEVARIIGKTVDEVIGQDDFTFFPVEQAEGLRFNDQDVISCGELVAKDEAVTTVDGQRIYQATKEPLRDRDGQVVGMFGIARDIRDITERTVTERKIQRPCRGLPLDQSVQPGDCSLFQ